jgi:predicted DNA-binding protein with PD1-like motif
MVRLPSSHAPGGLRLARLHILNLHRDGRLHPHMTLATPDKVIAGHLEPGTEVFTFAVVTIGVMNDADLRRVDDTNYR